MIGIKIKFSLLIFSFITLIASLSAQEICEECYCHCPKQFKNALFIGPEIYHVHRTREGGTKQNGWVYGARIGYDHLKRYKLYWGIDALYACGSLKGKNGSDDTIKSHFTDSNVEGRFGYTFQQKCGWEAAFTPFIGVGYFVEKNKFVSPSPIHATFRTRFAYGTLGFLSQISWSCQWKAGINFKVRFPYDPKCTVRDADEGSNTMKISEENQYRVELPITYLPCGYGCWYLSVVPFYEFRHYGQKANFPFDFLDTKLKIYGFTIKFFTGW